MQPKEPNTRSTDALNHPTREEWMSFLYGELAPDRKRELRHHLGVCPECDRQVKEWQLSMSALDDWKLPAVSRPRQQSQWQPLPILKWAAAAAVLLIAGIAIGRQSANNSRELAALKDSVAQLSQKLEAASTNSPTAEQVSQLLTEYAQTQDTQRQADRKNFALALRDIDLRVLKLRSELETVAINTETGFRQTQNDLTQLASYTAVDRLATPEDSNVEIKQQ